MLLPGQPSQPSPKVQVLDGPSAEPGPRASVDTADSDASDALDHHPLTQTRSKAPLDKPVGPDEARNKHSLRPLPRWVAGWDEGFDPETGHGFYVQRTLTASKPGDGTCTNGGKLAFTPFVASAAKQILIRGEMDPVVVAEELKKQGLYPIKTRNGKAIGTINVNYVEGWIKPEKYQEIVFAVDAAKEETTLPEPCLLRHGWCCCAETLRRWDLAYINFDSTDFEPMMFVHSLFVSNAYACDASRQTQAFPKHPTIIDKIDELVQKEKPGKLNISVKTSNGDQIVEATIRDRWPCCCGLCGCSRASSCCMLPRMACAMLCSFGCCPLLKLLCAFLCHDNPPAHSSSAPHARR